jgi:TetR/AcrR family transcriptional regulator
VFSPLQKPKNWSNHLNKNKPVKDIIRARKKREKKHRVESIIDSAKRVFFKKGYLKATMDEIARGAEITKPTIYQYFKNKDDLFFSLMTPVIDDIGVQLEKIWEKLENSQYKSGEKILREMFQAFYHSYELSPDIFRIVQMFQQTNLVSKLTPEVRDAMNRKGRNNFQLGRKILTTAMKRGLIKKMDTNSLVDLFWGLTVGIIQLEDIKKDDQFDHRYKRSVLGLAENIFVEALNVK